MCTTAIIKRLSETDTITIENISAVWICFQPLENRYPAITVTLQPKSKPTHYVGGFAGHIYRQCQIDVWSYDVDECLDQAFQVAQCLVGFSGDIDGTQIDFIEWLDEFDGHEKPDDGSDQPLYRRILLFRVKHRLPIPEN